MFNYFLFIKTLIGFSPRQLEGEVKAARFIISLLGKNKISYNIQRFKIKLPRVKNATLKADGELMECEACCYVSGKIFGKYNIISSLLPSTVCQNTPNINFNPKCPVISSGNHYFAPAVSVSHKTLGEILKAKDVQGEVVVDKVNHEAVNILAGNRKNPQHICFAHYDSIKKGALDNASSVSILMGAILSRPDTLKNTLYVFSACEELSYEKPIYHGYGYRIFEKRFYKLLQGAKKIIVLECVGDGEPKILQDPKMVEYGFPIINLSEFINKMFIITGNFDHCMTIYHSDLDDGRGIKKKYLLDTQICLNRFLEFKYN